MMAHRSQEGQGHHQEHNTMHPTFCSTAPGPTVQGRSHVREATDSVHSIHRHNGRTAQVVRR